MNRKKLTYGLLFFGIGIVLFVGSIEIDGIKSWYDDSLDFEINDYGNMLINSFSLIFRIVSYLFFIVGSIEIIISLLPEDVDKK